MKNIAVDKIDKMVGANVRAFRLKAGLSQAALAEKAGIAFITMGVCERGDQSPSCKTLIKIANALGVEIKEFFYFD